MQILQTKNLKKYYGKEPNIRLVRWMVWIYPSIRENLLP